VLKTLKSLLYWGDTWDTWRTLQESWRIF